MASNLFGKRFAGQRELGWHELGAAFKDSPDLNTALQRHKMLYPVESYPVVIRISDTEYIDTGKKGIVRAPTEDDPQYRVFGTVGKNYTWLDNADLGNMLNPLTKKWPVETIGALGYGETVFIALSVGNSQIGGEDISNYFLVSDSKGNGEALTVAYTPVRLVCHNMLSMGKRMATSSVKLRHYPSISRDLQFQIDLVGRLQTKMELSQRALERLTLKKIVEEQVETILKRVYSLAQVPQKAQIAADLPAEILEADEGRVYADSLSEYEIYKGRIEAYRGGAKELYVKFNDEHPKLAKTGWALYNAIVECEDYRQGNQAAKSALFGVRAKNKERAFDIISIARSK